MGKIREFQCRHEADCSQPGVYWKMASCAMMFDSHGNVKETIMPDEKIQEGDHFSCSECGQEAWLKWVDEREINGRNTEKAEQEAML